MSLAYETMVKSLEENDIERSRMSKETNQCVRERERKIHRTPIIIQL